MDEWIKKMWCIPTMTDYSALTKNILPYMTWVNLEDICLVKYASHRKKKYYLIPLMWGIKSSQIQKQRVEWWLPGVGAGKTGSCWLVGNEASVMQDEQVLELCCTVPCLWLTYSFVHLKCVKRVDLMLNVLTTIFLKVSQRKFS